MIADAPELMTTREAAIYLKLSHRTLSMWRYEKKGPNYVKLEGEVRYVMDDIQAWLHRDRRPATRHHGDTDSLP